MINNVVGDIGELDGNRFNEKKSLWKVKNDS